MRDMDKIRQSVSGMEFDLDEFEKMLVAQHACIEALEKTDRLIEMQFNAQRACLEELVNSVESLQRQIDSLKTQVGVALQRPNGLSRNRV